MKTKTIRQIVSFKAEPKQVYELLMDSKKHSGFSESKVKMSRKANGKFETYDGYIHGRNVELVEDKKIVQDWHFAENGWPDDHFSTCIFEFENLGMGTRLTFTQTKIPEHLIENLKRGWNEFYWERMKRYLLK
ncbi:MAG: SRPBCC domain-containing protein [Bacteroidia bacterium]|nr:SRPBCC domain-containing protein [Bacteroidia bacterium]